jgi:glyoxylase-like metal-dependent hydrolase (beta-lactamase superfamily II)
MEICTNIHRLKIIFQVTETVNRYVYVYIIFGEKIYLVDTGIRGSVFRIIEHLKKHGRDISEISDVFLTHAHPDHIGGLADIKKIVPDCRVYGPKTEQIWVENIDEQFRQRPIPNFYTLVAGSVKLHKTLSPGEKVEMENGLIFTTIDSKGHSHGSISYLLNAKILFTGDAIPARGDFPIFTSLDDSIKTLSHIMRMNNVEILLPAWDDRIIGNDIAGYIQGASDSLIKIKEIVQAICLNYQYQSIEEKYNIVCAKLKIENLKNNPLFQRSITSAILENT